MERIYNASDLQAVLRRDLEHASGALQAWKNVKRLHKKDGGDFANMRKNFDGLYISEQYSYSARKNMYSAEVCFYERGHKTDTLYEAGCSADDIEAAISARIVILEQKVVSLSAQVDKAAAAWDVYVNGLDSIKQGLADLGLPKRSDVHYKLTEALRNTFMLI